MNIKKPSKTQGESWKLQWRRQCFARTGQRNSPAFRKLKRRVVNPTRFQRTKHACIVEAHESTRQRLESSLPKDHEDHIAGKRYNSMTHYNLVTRTMGSPRHAKNRRTREGLRECGHLCVSVAHAGEEGRNNVLPWYRPVGVASRHLQ